MLIGLALCEHEGCNQRYLFRCPAHTTLEKGDKVIVETKKGKQMATVVCSCCVFDDSDEYKMILAMANDPKELRRVDRVVRYIKLDYGSEKNESMRLL